MSRPFQQAPRVRLQCLEHRIAAIEAERESLKQAIGTGRIGTAEGLRRLKALNSALTEFDYADRQDRDSQQ